MSSSWIICWFKVVFLPQVKQLKMREESSDIKEDLPLRLKIFEKFPERPLMTSLSKIPSDFATPKVRDSFVSKFVYETEEDRDEANSPDLLMSRYYRFAKIGRAHV